MDDQTRRDVLSEAALAELRKEVDLILGLAPERQYEKAESVVRSAATRALAEPQLRAEFAYLLAGLLSSPVLGRLEEDDVLNQALLLLGELELPSRHHSDGVSWQRLNSLLDQRRDSAI